MRRSKGRIRLFKLFRPCLIREDEVLDTDFAFKRSAFGCVVKRCLEPVLGSVRICSYLGNTKRQDDFSPSLYFPSAFALLYALVIS